MARARQLCLLVSQRAAAGAVADWIVLLQVPKHASAKGIVHHGEEHSSDYFSFQGDRSFALQHSQGLSLSNDLLDTLGPSLDHDPTSPHQHPLLAPEEEPQGQSSSHVMSLMNQDFTLVVDVEEQDGDAPSTSPALSSDQTHDSAPPSRPGDPSNLSQPTLKNQDGAALKLKTGRGSKRRAASSKRRAPVKTGKLSLEVRPFLRRKVHRHTGV
jgi:hypothetical protein